MGLSTNPQERGEEATNEGLLHARERDFRLLGVLSVEHRSSAHDLGDMSRECLGADLSELFDIEGRLTSHFDFDQFVVRERLIDLSSHGIRESELADLHRGPKSMGKRTQVSQLLAGEFFKGTHRWAHRGTGCSSGGPKSKSGRGAGQRFEVFPVFLQIQGQWAKKGR